MLIGLGLRFQVVIKSKPSPFLTTPGVLRYWWLFAAFIVPFALAFYPHWRLNLAFSLSLGLRSGIVGLVVACVVYVLWKIDCHLNHAYKPDRYADSIILILGILLWLVWFSTCQMILIAYDEVDDADLYQTWHR